jgi:NAD(P)-dependent dehydrogenase (short-subunit alcohol dehydrogenase family)
MDTVLVTGASSGIGRASARAFAREDWTVYAGARSETDLAELDEAGFEAVELDVTDPDDCARSVAELVEAEGAIDCLVNNAGYGQAGAVEDVPPRKLHEQFDVNLYGPHRLIRAALPHMREAGDGTVVNVSSWIGRVALPGAGGYAASKAALEALSDSLRAEVREFGVDVVLVEPGPVETGFDDRLEEELDGLDRSGAYETLYELVRDHQAVNGIGASSPEEVADVVVNAATCADPAPRYPVGPVGRLGPLLRHVPARWRDRAYGLVSRVVR